MCCGDYFTQQVDQKMIDKQQLRITWNYKDY